MDSIAGAISSEATEFGTLGASVWLMAFWLIQRSGQAGQRVTMLLCIVGNVIVSLAWFGPESLPTVAGWQVIGHLMRCWAFIFFFTIVSCPYSKRLRRERQNMFDLEQAILEWRRQMTAGGIKAPEVLDELESHLHDDVDSRCGRD